MVQDSPGATFLKKADESLAGAESEFANNRFHNVANRCYYARFLAAVYALRQAGTQPVGSSDAWSHGFVQAQFASQLIGRLKRYPAELRDTLSRALILRRRADYTIDEVSRMQTEREWLADPRMRAAIEELRALVSSRYPATTFALAAGDDPAGLYLTATVDVDDPEEVVDTFIDRLLEFEIDEGLALYLIPIRTPERRAALAQPALPERFTGSFAP